jgi:hypothetical protein
MDALWGAIIFHLATIILGAVGLRQLKRTSSNIAVGAIFVVLLAAQSVPTLMSYFYSRQLEMGPMLYLTFFFFAPVGGAAALVWLVVGGTCDEFKGLVMSILIAGVHRRWRADCIRCELPRPLSPCRELCR